VGSPRLSHIRNPQLSAPLPWLVTAHHRELPYMPAWLVPASRHSAAAATDFHARQSTAATARKANPALYREMNVGPGLRKIFACGVSNFLLLALFSFCSSIKLRNRSRISTALFNEKKP